MISFREVECPRSGDVAVQAFRVFPGGLLITAERILRYVDLQDRQLGDRLRVTTRRDLHHDMEDIHEVLLRRKP